MKIAIFASSLRSSYWNGAATYYRGLVSALARRGVEIAFYEPDAFGRGDHVDFDPGPRARVIVYPPTDAAARATVAEARAFADVLIKASGVGVADDTLIEAVASAKGRLRVFWDVDAPATLTALAAGSAPALSAALPRLDGVLTYAGGSRLRAHYLAHGARACVPVFNAHDPATHHPAPVDPALAADVGLLANRLPDREDRFHAFFTAAANLAPERTFVLGGEGWADVSWPANVRWIGHVPAPRHNAFNASMRLVLNIARAPMAAFGHSPATRVFEAAAAGACIVTDEWPGISAFFEPGRELLVSKGGADIAAFARRLTDAEIAAIGAAARARVLRDHTYDQRAETMLAALARFAAPISAADSATTP